MTQDKVLKAMKSLDIKNCEGPDQIPQRVLADGIEILHEPFSHLFNLIYSRRTIPEQWKISKITPIHKKGNNMNGSTIQWNPIR